MQFGRPLGGLAQLQHSRALPVDPGPGQLQQLLGAPAQALHSPPKPQAGAILRDTFTARPRNLASHHLASHGWLPWRQALVRAFPASEAVRRALRHAGGPWYRLGSSFPSPGKQLLSPHSCLLLWTQVQICQTLGSRSKVTRRGQTATHMLTVQSSFP